MISNAWLCLQEGSSPFLICDNLDPSWHSGQIGPQQDVTHQDLLGRMKIMAEHLTSRLSQQIGNRWKDDIWVAASFIYAYL